MSFPRRWENRRTWQRLTLLDLLLVQAAFGLSFSLAASLGAVEVGGVERAMAGIVWGLVFAGPITLMAQWTLRRRSRGLSAGEWLWLTPTVLFALLWFSVKGPAAAHPGLSRSLFWVWTFAQVTAIGIALATLFSGLRGFRNDVPCRWTDRTGAWTGLLFGVWMFLFVLPFALAG
jgi:hypothetical protein